MTAAYHNPIAPNFDVDHEPDCPHGHRADGSDFCPICDSEHRPDTAAVHWTPETGWTTITDEQRKTASAETVARLTKPNRLTDYYATLDAQSAHKTDEEVIAAYQACMPTVPYRDLVDRSRRLTATVARCRTHRCEDAAIRREIARRLAR